VHYAHINNLLTKLAGCQDSNLVLSRHHTLHDNFLPSAAEQRSIPMNYTHVAATTSPLITSRYLPPRLAVREAFKGYRQEC